MTMIAKIWRFIAKPQNLAVILAIGGALGFLWKEVLSPHFKAHTTQGEARVSGKPPSLTQSSQSANASGGGIAVAAASNAQVAIGAPLKGASPPTSNDK